MRCSGGNFSSSFVSPSSQLSYSLPSFSFFKSIKINTPIKTQNISSLNFNYHNSFYAKRNINTFNGTQNISYFVRNNLQYFLTISRRISNSKLQTIDDYMKKPEIQTLLRQFYKKVHPDLFVEADLKENNQQSLSAIMTFVENWRRRPSGAPFSAISKKTLKFYLKTPLKKANEEKTEENNENGEVENNNNEPKSYDILEMVLFENYPYSTVKSEFSRVFSLLGIPTDFRVGDKIISKSDDSTIDEFLLKNIQLARDLSEKEKHSAKLLADVRQKLSNYSLELSINEVWECNSNYDNFKSLDRFYRIVIDSLPNMPNVHSPQLSVLEIMKEFKYCFTPFSPGCNVDYQNKLVTLDPESSDVDWLDIIANLSLAELEAAKREKEDLLSDTNYEVEKRMDKLRANERDMQRSVEKALNVQFGPAPQDSYYIVSEGRADDPGSVMVSIEFNLENEHRRYLLYLESLVNQFKELRNLRTWDKKKFRHLRVYVRSFSDREKLFHLSGEGEIFISNKVTPPQLIKIVDKLGPRALELMRIEEEWENRRNFVGARLGVRSIHSSTVFHQLIRDAKKKERMAIEKIEQNVVELKSLNLSGLEIGISHEYEISETGLIWIKWDFQLETMKKFFLEATKNHPPPTDHESSE